jgi:selenide,water dikinase
VPDRSSHAPRTSLSRQEMNPRGGCQCKFPGLDLAELIDGAVEWAAKDGAHVIAPGPPEDCAIIDSPVTRLLASTELTPLVGVDLYESGRIAALHAMSDIYASGGTPRWALATLVAKADDPAAHTRAVLAGILNACASEGAQVVGGQTIIGPEAMAGLTVIGVPQSSRILRKRGSRPGDRLLLSKPLGVGLVLRGYKLGLLDEQALRDAVSIMTTSNASASAAALKADVHASTDVTGFGLLGHLAEMLAPELGATLELSKVPVLAAAATLPAAVAQTFWIESNYEYATNHNEIRGISERQRLAILLDPQTNGGLLVGASEAAAARLASSGFTVIGRITDAATFDIVE